MSSERSPFLTKKDESKLIGAHVPLPLAERLHLIEIVENKSAQQIVHNLLYEWAERYPQSNDLLIEAAAQKAMKEWDRRVRSGTVESNLDNKRKYLNEINLWLHRRKISFRHAKQITDRIQQKIETLGDVSAPTAKLKEVESKK